MNIPIQRDWTIFPNYFLAFTKFNFYSIRSIFRWTRWLCHFLFTLHKGIHKEIDFPKKFLESEIRTWTWYVCRLHRIGNTYINVTRITLCTRKVTYIFIYSSDLVSGIDPDTLHLRIFIQSMGNTQKKGKNPILESFNLFSYTIVQTDFFLLKHWNPFLSTEWINVWGWGGAKIATYSKSKSKAHNIVSECVVIIANIYIQNPSKP